MQYDELHQRYGNHIARRLQAALKRSEFSQIDVEELTAFLEMRAATAHKEYQSRLDNRFINEELGAARAAIMDAFYRRWREAEDIAYLVIVAEGVGVNARLVAAGGR
jgi:hypothetical protein